MILRYFRFYLYHYFQYNRQKSKNLFIRIVKKANYKMNVEICRKMKTETRIQQLFREDWW